MRNAELDEAQAGIHIRHRSGLFYKQDSLKGGLRRRKKLKTQVGVLRRASVFSFKPGAHDYTTKQLSLNSILRIL